MLDEPRRPPAAEPRGACGALVAAGQVRYVLLGAGLRDGARGRCRRPSGGRCSHARDVSRAAGAPGRERSTGSRRAPAHPPACPTGVGTGSSANRAPGSLSSSVRSPSICRASSRPIARPRPNPPSCRVGAALEALEDAVAVVRGHAGPVVLDDDAGQPSVDAHGSTRIALARRRRGASALSSRMRTICATLPGIADAPSRRAAVDVDRAAALAERAPRARR